MIIILLLLIIFTYSYIALKESWSHNNNHVINPFLQAAFANIETLTLARFLLESSLLESRFVANRASFMAASCLRLAMMMNSCGEWTPTLVHFTGYTSNELRDCVLQLNSMNSAPANKNLMTVKNKYSHKVFHEVAKIPALDTLTIEI